MSVTDGGIQLDPYSGEPRRDLQLLRLNLCFGKMQWLLCGVKMDGTWGPEQQGGQRPLHPPGLRPPPSLA